jgi:hypothetical protein
VLIVLIGAAIVIVVWSTWLVHARRVPRWVRSVAPAVVVATVVSGSLTMWQMHRAYAAAVDGEAAEKASQLAGALSAAMNTLAAGLVVTCVGALILAYFTLRRR